MQEYWFNVYNKEGQAVLGAYWPTEKEADDSSKGNGYNRSYRIHVKLKETTK